VDFVLTFEELNGMFEAKEINFETIEPMFDLDQGSAAGRGFAVAGGVAKAVENLVHETHPDMEIKTARAEGLRECRKLMTLAKAGKYNGYLLEGMACPGGCVAGAGTIRPIRESTNSVQRFKDAAPDVSCTASPYLPILKEVEERD
jgi:iron only hydrogenase large subunit-like protein